MVSGKKIGIGAGVIIALLIVIGIFGAAANQNGNNAIQNSSAVSSSASKTVAKPVTDLLPTRQDIGTEYVIANALTDSSQFRAYKDASYVKGYTESTQQAYSKTETFTGTTVRVTIYKFHSPDEALSSYNNFTSNLIQNGGFTQVDTNGIDAKCYGTQNDAGIYDLINHYCVKENIYFHTAFAGSATNDDGAMIFSKAVASRIG